MASRKNRQKIRITHQGALERRRAVVRANEKAVIVKPENRAARLRRLLGIHAQLGQLAKQLHAIKAEITTGTRH